MEKGSGEFESGRFEGDEMRVAGFGVLESEGLRVC
jgi:hypothetical protein